MLFFHLTLDLQNGLIPPDFRKKIPNALRSKFLSHLIRSDFITSNRLRRGLQIKKLLVLRFSRALFWFICRSSNYSIYHHLLIEQIQNIQTDAQKLQLEVDSTKSDFLA
jgi:hypothetical protein